MGPVAQLGGVGVQGGELAVERVADVDEPVGREGRTGAGWLPFGAGGHLEAKQGAHRVAALGAAGGHDGLVYPAVVDIEVPGVVGEDRRWAVAVNQGLDAPGDVDQGDAVQAVVRQVVKVDRGGAEDAGGGLRGLAALGQVDLGQDR